MIAAAPTWSSMRRTTTPGDLSLVPGEMCHRPPAPHALGRGRRPHRFHTLDCRRVTSRMSSRAPGGVPCWERGSGVDSGSDPGALRCSLRVARVRSSRRLDQKQVCLLVRARLVLDANRDDEQVAWEEHDVTVT